MGYRLFGVRKQLFVSCVLLGLAVSLASCSEDPPLKIGFVGGLTGRVADLGVAGRDGVVLAVEEKNQAGGIAGRKLELIIKDDRQEPEFAKQAVRELDSEGVVAIVGPMTSSIAVVIQPLINASQTVTISPTVKTDQLSGQDDFFLRVTTPLSRNAVHIANHAVTNLQLKKFAVAYDVSNREFTETWLGFFKQALLEKGGQITVAEEFLSQPEIRFLPIAERMLASEPEAILLLSNAIDTALLAQQVRKLKSKAVLFSSEWASTTDLLSFGGRAVNGMVSFHSFNANSQEPRYLTFKEKFKGRFGYDPSFASSLAYDAASFLLVGLEKDSTRTGLKGALLRHGSFPGLQSAMSFDKFGDVERKLFLTVIENGQFEVVE